MNDDMLEILGYWITERENIRIAKDRGDPKPWTDDAIMQQFKFCNVRREDDRVTKWFAHNWRSPQYWDEPNFVSALILGRTINWPDTLAEIGFPKEWSEKYVYDVLERRAARKEKVYTGAYMVSQYGSKLPKNQLVVANASAYFGRRPHVATTLEDTYEYLVQYEGVGPFMAGQVIADLKQTKWLRHAADWYTWATLGPGSTRGLNRLYDRNLNFQPSQEQGLKEMREVAAAMSDYQLCLQDIQNCLCEFDKYVRTKTGTGVPRSRYPGF